MIEVSPAGEVTLTWNSKNGKSYFISATDDLEGNDWQEVADGVDSDGEMTSYTDSSFVPADWPVRYYRIGEQE